MPHAKSCIFFLQIALLLESHEELYDKNFSRIRLSVVENRMSTRGGGRGNITLTQAELAALIQEQVAATLVAQNQNNANQNQHQNVGGRVLFEISFPCSAYSKFLWSSLLSPHPNLLPPNLCVQLWVPTRTSFLSTLTQQSSLVRKDLLGL